MLDEPTGSLDVRSARQLLGSLRAWARERDSALLVVSHRLGLQVPGVLQAVVLLEGQLHGPYEAEDVLEGRVESEVVRAFLGALEADE